MLWVGKYNINENLRLIRKRLIKTDETKTNCGEGYFLGEEMKLELWKKKVILLTIIISFIVFKGNILNLAKNILIIWNIQGENS